MCQMMLKIYPAKPVTIWVAIILSIWFVAHRHVKRTHAGMLWARDPKNCLSLLICGWMQPHSRFQIPRGLPSRFGPFRTS